MSAVFMLLKRFALVAVVEGDGPCSTDEDINTIVTPTAPAAIHTGGE
jgi:hypothetical protein